MPPLSLASVTVGDAIKPPRTVVYGGDGIGKTTFAAGAASPIFIRSEDGLGVLQVPAFPPAESFLDVLEAMRVLYKEEHTFRTLVVDSLDWLEQLVWAHTAALKKVEHLEDIPYGKGYLFAEEHWQTFFKGLDALRDRKGMGIILICHAEIKRFDAPDTQPYDRYQLKLHKRATARTMEWADIVGFAQHETIVREADVGFNKQVRRGVGTGARVLHLSEQPAFDAKNRFALPATIPLEYSAFREALRSALQARSAPDVRDTRDVPEAPEAPPTPAEEAA